MPGSRNSSTPGFPSPTPAEFDPGSPVESASSDPSSCPFCHIAAVYPPYDPARPPAAESSLLRPDATAPGPATFVVLSTPLAVAFLDILPLSPGHLLVCPRAHRPKLTDVTGAEARELGFFVSVLSAALAAATGIADWNVVQNNGAAAAQVVPHMHFHVIPRPGLSDRGRERFTATMFGRGAREELDEDEAVPLAARIRVALAEHLLNRGNEKPKI